MSIDDDTCNFCNGYDRKYLTSQVYLIQSLASIFLPTMLLSILHLHLVQIANRKDTFRPVN
jgi:hypothetical protein